jgi:purine-cytosine permease-like protein
VATVERDVVGALPEGDRIFHIEQHGIDHIPDSERWAKPRDLFGMWAGVSFNAEYFVYGVILMTFGFSFAQALWITIVGNLSYVLLGVASLQGPQTGTTVFTINRAAYGPNGSRVIAFFNWLTQVGFETEGLVLIVFAGIVISEKAGFSPGVPAKVVFIVVGVAVQLLLPLLGHATLVKTARLLVLPFIALYAVLAGLTLGNANFDAVRTGAGWETILGGLAFVIVLSGLGWAECGNDYSRYLPEHASRRSIVGWVFLGTAVPEILVMLLGVVVGTYTFNYKSFNSPFGGSNPFAAFVTPHVHVFATGFVVPFLCIAILQLFTINSLDLYSSGVTLQALGLKVERWQAVLVDTAVCLLITIYAVFSSTFSTLLKDFVDLVVVWIAPWLAIFLVDWALRKFSYRAGELQRTDAGSAYYRRGGIFWPGVVAQFVGMIGSIEALSPTFRMPTWLHAINHAFGGTAPGYGADFSVFTGMAVGGLVYLLLAGRTVRREVAESA